MVGEAMQKHPEHSAQKEATLVLPHEPGLLILGPTGSGKTPLGQYLATYGLAGRRTVHFDFGAQLRASIEPGPDGPPLCGEERDFIRGVLQSGALLEDSHFYLAEKLLLWFLRRENLRQGEWLILNGVPRHQGQAIALQPTVKVRFVVELVCEAAVVAERIRGNVGGDRTGRDDDDPEAIRKKLDLYHQRTQPLVSFYLREGVQRIAIPVLATTAAAEMATQLEAALKDIGGA